MDHQDAQPKTEAGPEVAAAAEQVAGPALGPDLTGWLDERLAPWRVILAGAPPRWRTALHEAGHVVLARVLGSPRNFAAVFDDDGGMAFDKLPNDSIEAALVTAAGRIAESLADTFSAPMDQPAPSAFSSADSKDFRRAGDRHEKDTPCDEDRVAQWCIAGHADLVESWAQRHAWITSYARGLVAENAELIRRVAEHLYSNVHVNPDELTMLMPADAGATALIGAKEA